MAALVATGGEVKYHSRPTARFASGNLLERRVLTDEVVQEKTTALLGDFGADPGALDLKLWTVEIRYDPRKGIYLAGRKIVSSERHKSRQLVAARGLHVQVQGHEFAAFNSGGNQ